jgi:CheY-like chemotaxis protein
MIILLVDDDAVGIAVRAKLLTVSGHTAIIAHSGHEAVEIAKGTEMDAAVLDYNLPDMAGDELIDRLREIKPGMPLILLSGQMDIPGATQAKVAHYLIKGSGATRLLAAIEEVRR